MIRLTPVIVFIYQIILCEFLFDRTFWSRLEILRLVENFLIIFFNGSDQIVSQLDRDYATLRTEHSSIYEVRHIPKG